MLAFEHSHIASGIKSSKAQVFLVFLCPNVIIIIGTPQNHALNSHAKLLFFKFSALGGYRLCRNIQTDLGISIHFKVRCTSSGETLLSF